MNAETAQAEIAAPPVSEGVVFVRRPLAARLNRWRKRTPLNPYWLELRELERAVSEIAVHARGRLIDVGVAERPWGRHFEGRARRYFGLEYPPVADNLSPGIWQAMHRLKGVVDVFGDAGKLPFRDRSWDTVLAIELLEHVRDPDAAMAEFARVIAPDGRLLLTVPFVAARHQLPFDFVRFTPDGIRALVERHGFTVEVIRPRGNSATAVGAMLAHYLVRGFAAHSEHVDGSVRLSRIRALFVLPFVALAQIVFALFARLTKDTSLSLGYSVVARRATPAR
ncbi:MAG: class I SAM-dependent methyltransferase [Planctomycetes bacterium]|nr:class I SAM-dependent methyltransferase [Planctomycetota bacterium]